VKPSPFAWSAPTSVPEALALLAHVGGDGKVLAGGQSLLPVLRLRLNSPEKVIDLGWHVPRGLHLGDRRHEPLY